MRLPFFVLISVGTLISAAPRPLYAQQLPDELQARMLAGPRAETSQSGQSFRPRPTGSRGGLSGPGLSLRELTAASRSTPILRPVFDFTPEVSQSTLLARQGRQQLVTQQQLSARQAQTALQAVPRAGNVVPHILTVHMPLAADIDPTQREQRLGEMMQRTFGEDSRTFRVHVRGETAILTGETPPGTDSELLSRLLRLEPGIYRVENQLKRDGEP